MASIANDRNGFRRVVFTSSDGRRLSLRLGKVSRRTAESVLYRVEQLLEALAFNRPMEADLAGWVSGLEPWLADRLSRVGLIPEPGSGEEVVLGKHLESYFARRCDVKKSTLAHWNHTKRLLTAYFGEDRRLESITAGDAKDWERWLRTPEARENRYGASTIEEGLAVNTARKRVSNAKQFFQDAVSHKLLETNPFAGLKGSVGSNRDRDFFLTRTDAAKIAEACPDSEWRLIFALSRFGGLRCPSEHLALRWSDVDWERSRFLVRSPKTEKYDGKGVREVPIFPELKQPLNEVWANAEVGNDHVITRYRSPNQNLRTRFEKIVRRAGLEPWPKLFQNLRASRATELASEFPGHIAAAWLGHSTTVAQKHYWQVTDSDFAKAIGSGELETEEAKAAQKAAQQVHARGGRESQEKLAARKKTRFLPGIASLCSSLQDWQVGDEGLEPPTSSL